MSSRSLDNPVKEYDVFLNFRGMDTRNGFTSHLHSALEQQKYKVFIDDEELERGSFIKESLLEAIENSSSSIPIISENYASSTACLRELAKIVECKKTWGQTVIPVFYHVNPSLLKNLRIQSYKEEFSEYWINPKYKPEEVQSWKDALAEVCGLAGWTIYEFRDNEAQMIKKIVADLQKRLHILNQSSNDEPSTQSTLPYMADVDRSLQSMKLNKVTLPSGDLSRLKELDLSSQNISDKAFPDQFDSLVSLEELDLGQNPFTALPQSIKALSKLKYLLLERCDRLKSLGPELPSSLLFVNVSYCTSLESFMDPEIPNYDIRVAAYCAECHKLVEKQGSKKTALTALERYFTNLNQCDCHFQILLPGNEIPEWFKEQSSGPSISKKLTPGWCKNGFQGFALAACFTSFSPEGLVCYMEVDDRETKCVNFEIPVHNDDTITSPHLWLIFCPASSCKTEMHEWKDSLGNLEISFSGKNNRKEVFSSCAVRLVYKKLFFP